MNTNSIEVIEKEEYNKNIKNIDHDIDSLNKYLLEIKKNRKNSELIENKLSKRKNILNNEEIKLENQLKLEAKNKEYREIIKVNVLKDKELLETKKKIDQINLTKQKTKNNIMKQEINKSLKNWKNNLKIKNKEDADKIFRRRSSK